MIDELLHGEDRGVSPVIGVILMVAITVILAAVIGTFVLNLGGSVQENVQAGVNVNCDAASASGEAGSVQVTWTSNQNADNVEVTSTSGNLSAAGSPDSGSNPITSVGGSATYDESSNGVQSEVSVTVTANAGDTSTVISTKECTV